jgi:predicted house-cleaning noncanonical NTP pyrophosphatase (MazG superfamily)
MLDKHTIDRIEGIINQKALASLKTYLEIITDDMFADGFYEEDVYEYFRGLVIEIIEKSGGEQ